MEEEIGGWVKMARGSNVAEIGNLVKKIENM